MPEEQQRRLAAIMFSDIVGYSSLMHQNEIKAIRILEKNRNLHKAMIDLYRGKYLKEIGDGTLASFDAASDAVRCATALQRVAREDPDLKLHIGIHVGEVIFSGNDVYGDGVNIASRIDSAAKEGEVYISEVVYKNIQNKEDINAEYLGKQKFKNIREPIGLYRLSYDRVKNKNWMRIWAGMSFKNSLIAVLSIFVLITAYFLYNSIHENYIASKYENSLAVLPFKNIVGDDEGAYFADGVTEAIRGSHLSKVKTLKVISGISAAQYRDPDKSAPQIASELGVVYLLEGSAQKFKGDLQITVELINAQKDETIWVDVYKRELTDIFTIQSEIANAVGEAMQAQITSEEYERIVEVPTKDLDAYDFYVKGRYFWNKRTEDDLLIALDLFNQAVNIDPDFALAWSGIADTYNMLWGYGYIPFIEVHQEALKAVENALALNPKSAEAYTAMGWIKAFYNHDWAGSGESFNLAIQYEPNYSTTHSWYAWILSAQGNFERAQQHVHIARSLDPLSNIILASAGWIFYVSGSYIRAQDLFKSAIEMNPDFPRFHMWMGQNYMINQQYDSALMHLKKAVTLSDRHPQYLSSLGFCYGVAGQNENANNILNEILEKAEIRYVSSYDIALAFLGTNQETLAIEHFERAYHERDIWIVFIGVDPRFTFLHENPHFIKILDKTGIALAWND